MKESILRKIIAEEVALIIKEMPEITEVKNSESDLLKLATKAGKSARFGSTEIKAYLKSLKNTFRIDGTDDYSDYSQDDFEEDIHNYIADRG